VEEEEDIIGKNPVAASVPMRVGHMIKASLQTLLGNAIMNNDEEERKNAEDLLKLYEMQWGDRVSSKFFQLAQDPKMNRPGELPTEEDFAKLIQGLKEKLAIAIKNLEEYKSVSN
jgi:hypothetical protein